MYIWIELVTYPQNLIANKLILMNFYYTRGDVLNTYKSSSTTY